MRRFGQMIKECPLQNDSFYSRGDYLFTYFEYVGDDYKADMARMAAARPPSAGGTWSSR